MALADSVKVNTHPFKFLEDNKLVVDIRSSSADDAEAMIQAALQGGLRVFEISMQTAQGFRILENYSKKDDCLFGAGSITDGEMAQRAINAGARFVASSYTDRDVITVAKHNDVFVIQGAFTPTEAMNAYQLGADVIRLFPVKFSGGPEYVKLLRSSFPFLKLMAHGGITMENAFVFLKDCVAVAVGETLFDRSLLRADNWAEITDRARQLSQKLETLKTTK